MENLFELESILREEYEVLRVHLSEQGRRKWAAQQAKRIGYGGKGIVRRATGLDYKTINRGLREIKEVSQEAAGSGRVRKSGGGRKKLTESYPNLKEDLEALVEETTRGDAETVLKWTSKSTANLLSALKEKGYEISQKSVYNLLVEIGYSLQANRKVLEGGEHPDRDAQFSYINEKTKALQKEGQPVISVDTKKKEKICNFKNIGKEYHKPGQAPAVNVYDFLDKEKGKVSPYGVYDLDKNKGWVSVGISHDTGAFAVNSIRSWWYQMGKETYPDAKKLYINADGGGSNGWRNRLWKRELQKLANELGIEIHVSHFPPGTSKWNKIEHRMFCFISQNWRGRPLIDRATVLSLIAATKTKTGLTIRAKLDENEYQSGIHVSDEEFEKIALYKDTFHGEWNYLIKPH